MYTKWLIWPTFLNSLVSHRQLALQNIQQHTTTLFLIVRLVTIDFYIDIQTHHVYIRYIYVYTVRLHFFRIHALYIQFICNTSESLTFYSHFMSTFAVKYISTCLANVCICNFCACLLAPTKKLWTSTPDPGAPRRTPPTLGAGRWWSRRTRRWHPTWLLPLAVTGPSSCPQNQARANIWTTSCGWWKLCECVNLYKQEYIDYMYICFTYYIDFDIHIIYHSIPYFLNSIKFFRYKQCNRLWQKYGHMQSEVSCFE